MYKFNWFQNYSIIHLSNINSEQGQVCQYTHRDTHTQKLLETGFASSGAFLIPDITQKHPVDRSSCYGMGEATVPVLYLSLTHYH